MQCMLTSEANEDIRFGVDTCANIVGVTKDVAEEVGKHGHSKTFTSAGAVDTVRCVADVPAIGRHKATLLPQGSNIVGCNILVREKFGFTWLPEELARLLNLPTGPVTFKPDGSFVRCDLENGKPVISQKMMKNTESLKDYRSQQQEVMAT